MIIDANSEVEKMIDNESKDSQSTPDHESGRFRRLHGCFMSVVCSRCSIFTCQGNGEDHME
jgi:hypothetical protein